MAHQVLSPDDALKDSLTREAIRTLGVETWEFLTRDLQKLTLDSLLVKRVFNRTAYYDGIRDDEKQRITYPLSSIFRDYSFVMAGAYKLFEGYVYLVAVKLYIACGSVCAFESGDVLCSENCSRVGIIPLDFI